MADIFLSSPMLTFYVVYVVLVLLCALWPGGNDAGSGECQPLPREHGPSPLPVSAKADRFADPCPQCSARYAEAIRRIRR